MRGFNSPDDKRDQFMLTGGLARKGYDWWWHSFTARDAQTGREQPFFIEFFCCNPALGTGTGQPVLGQLPQNRAAGVRPSYLMVKAGCWGPDARQLHRFFSWADVTILPGAPFAIWANDCFASEYELAGSIEVSSQQAQAHPEWMCDAGQMSWNLRMDKRIAFNVGYGTSTPLRALQAFEMYWHVQGMKTLFEGEVVLDGRRYIVEPETCHGYADKNWGSDFTSPWIWLASSNLTSIITGQKLRDTAFDIGGGRPKIFGVALDRKLLGAIWHEGRGYEFNFSKFWTGSSTRFDCRETEDDVEWRIGLDAATARLEVEARCAKSDMLLVNYEAPDGTKRHNRLWNGGNGEGIVRLFDRDANSLSLVDEMLAENIGCEYGVFDGDCAG